MKREETIKWLESLKTEIGKSEVVRLAISRGYFSVTERLRAKSGM